MKPFSVLFSNVFIATIMCITLQYSCNQEQTTPKPQVKPKAKIVKRQTISTIDSFSFRYTKCLTDAQFVCIDFLDDDIIFDIKYASNQNFMSRNLYKGFTSVYVHPLTAEKLHKACEVIRQLCPTYSLVIWDATRPVSVQQFMWDSATIEQSLKIRFLARPDKASLHNYGMAIDCSLADSNGRVLDMGTDYDHIGREAYICNEQQLLDKGILLPKHIENRKLLRAVMYRAGFYGNRYEWWHFNTLKRNEVVDNYTKILDFEKFEPAVKRAEK